MCFATTAKVNDVSEKVDYKYGEVETIMSISSRRTRGGRKRNQEMRKNGSGKQNEIQIQL